MQNILARNTAQTLSSCRIKKLDDEQAEKIFENPNITTVTGKIADLTGIEAFVNVTNLQLGYGEFSSIDISNIVLLEELFLNDNQLLTIDV